MRQIKTDSRQSYDVGLHRYMLSIYRYMGLGLAMTGAVPVLTAFMPLSIQRGIQSLFLLAMPATFGIAIYFGFAARNMRVRTAQGLFWAYSLLMGVVLTNIFGYYRAESIAKVFFITASMFGASSIYGSMTNRDLTSMGSFLSMGVIGLVIAGFVNIFLRSTGLDFAASFLGVIIFTGLIAYDTQTLKQTYYQLPDDAMIKEKMSIFGALQLYLNIINLFLSLLRLVGEKK